MWRQLRLRAQPLYQPLIGEDDGRAKTAPDWTQYIPRVRKILLAVIAIPLLYFLGNLWVRADACISPWPS